MSIFQIIIETIIILDRKEIENKTNLKWTDEIKLHSFFKKKIICAYVVPITPSFLLIKTISIILFVSFLLFIQTLLFHYFK